MDSSAELYILNVCLDSGMIEKSFNFVDMESKTESNIKMQILIFGASGATGKNLVNQALEKHYRVTQKHDHVSTKFDRVSMKFDRVSTKFDRVSMKFDRVSTKLDTVFVKILRKNRVEIY